MSRRYFRQSHGRFRQAQHQDFGHRILVCPVCQRFNPFGPYDGGPMTDPRDVWTKNRPATCHACGADLSGVKEWV